MQSRYRSGVGMLFYVVKYMKSHLANVVNELSKCMDGASLAAYKEMQRVNKFCFGHSNTLFKVATKA
jgi:hypothetical protein